MHFFSFCVFAAVALGAEAVPTATLGFADPFVLLDNGTYYAYGTYAGDGIAVAVSKDLKKWKLSKGRAAGGLALHKSDSYGNHSFWAPEVYKRDGKFVMLYSAEGHVCSAVADSPLGPFRQAEKKPLLERAGIDNSLFVDDAGRSWMVYGHFDRGNTIWLAELEKDWLHVKPGTARMLFRAEAPWEGNAITIPTTPLATRSPTSPKDRGASPRRIRSCVVFAVCAERGTIRCSRTRTENGVSCSTHMPRPRLSAYAARTLPISSSAARPTRRN